MQTLSVRGAEAVAYVAVNALLEGGPKLAEPYNKREWEIAMRRENPIHIAFAYQVDCTGQAWVEWVAPRLRMIQGVTCSLSYGAVAAASAALRSR